MPRKIGALEMLAIGFMLFAMFLGAGNTIFAPMVGQQAGKDLLVPMSGFLITGVGLVILAILALARVGGRVEKLSDYVSPTFTKIFCPLLFLVLGPLYVLPRTTSVVYEIAVRPHVASGNNTIALAIFSLIFTALAVWLSLDTSKFVDRLGKALTPIFSALLALIIIKSFITPLGEPQDPVDPYTAGAFIKGFTDGYGTMDALAALVFGGVFIKSLAGIGITNKKDILSTFIKAGLITAAGLSVLHLSLAWIGATSVSAIGYGDNGGYVLAESARALFGSAGLIIIGVVIVLTGITTYIACLAAPAEYFETLAPKVPYRVWLLGFALISVIFANFGLSTILSMTLPFLYLLYPVAMTLIILGLLHTVFKGYRGVYLGAVSAATVFAIFDALKAAGLFVEPLNKALGWIPLFESGGGWIFPALLGGVIGYIFARATHQTPQPLPEFTDTALMTQIIDGIPVKPRP